MNQKIIYKNELGGVTILTPILDSDLTIEDIALKDVPEGRPYKIITLEDIPTDRTFRDAWEADFSAPDGYGIGPAAWFATRK